MTWKNQLVEEQTTAMGSRLFELGLFDPSDSRVPMIPRTWIAQTVFRSEPWLRYQNLSGRNIYIRPGGEHNLSLIDDLTPSAVAEMKDAGFGPAVVVETSPNNFQAWLKHAIVLDRQTSTLAARKLAERFGGDIGAADWRHFGRLAGFTNRKPKHQDPVTGLYPFVRLIEASGAVYSEAERFVDSVRRELRERDEATARRRKRVVSHRAAANLKGIDLFRDDPRYGGDGTRVDLAYAVYALARGTDPDKVAVEIRSRDLSHKGSQHRQDDYVERTIKKALDAIERGR